MLILIWMERSNLLAMDLKISIFQIIGNPATPNPPSHQAGEYDAFY